MNFCPEGFILQKVHYQFKNYFAQLEFDQKYLNNSAIQLCGADQLYQPSGMKFSENTSIDVLILSELMSQHFQQILHFPHFMDSWIYFLMHTFLKS